MHKSTLPERPVNLHKGKEETDNQAQKESPKDDAKGDGDS